MTSQRSLMNHQNLSTPYVPRLSTHLVVRYFGLGREPLFGLVLGFFTTRCVKIASVFSLSVTSFCGKKEFGKLISIYLIENFVFTFSFLLFLPTRRFIHSSTNMSPIPGSVTTWELPMSIRRFSIGVSTRSNQYTS